MESTFITGYQVNGKFEMKLNVKEWLSQIIAYIGLFLMGIFVGLIGILTGFLSIIWFIADKILLLIE